MALKCFSPIVLTTQILTGSFLILAMPGCSAPPEISTATAQHRDIEVVINTNGIIEPVDGIGIYATIDGSLKTIHCSEGSEIVKGQPIFSLDAPQAQIALLEAKAALFQAKRQARTVLAGPSREELDSIDASIAEETVQLRQITADLSTEETLYEKGAVSKESVEGLKRKQELSRIRNEALKQKKENLLSRYSDEEKKWEQDKVAMLTDQVELLENQVREESITAPSDGILYSLPVKAGSFVRQGELLALIYESGKIRLRAYVDEPDLGRIRKGQTVSIEWDGMPGKQWHGTVVKPAEQIVSLNNRSIGNVLCALDEQPTELIPNINVRVDIVTDSKKNALVVPKSAVFSHNGQPSVLLLEGTIKTIKTVEPGLVSYEEIEILKGIQAGDTVALNPEILDTVK